ncbi:MAG: flagellar hook assembly protein FlgD [Gammaproteobacteria bacterium]|nr:flagellar hook assembly protein FlgD [Gammaproteobacteria bacterium]MCP4983751.1 flagellar hook assembly protein FlgD [Gammaproteobacteria bacterium]
MSEIDSKNIYSQLGLNQPAESSNKRNDELGQTEFLELMTAQLQYQDPLKPMENGDFLGQMAQFGTVSGINDLNTTFSSMSASFQSNQALQASTLVGRSVMVPSQSGFLEQGASLMGSVELDQPANKMVITIKNSAGQLVNRQQLGVQQAGLIDFEWNGQDANGNTMPIGEYQIAAEVYRGTEVSAGAVYTVVDVESVTLGVGGQDLTLSVSGLGDIDMSQVRKIM